MARTHEVPEVADTDASSSAAQHPVSVSQDTDLDLEALQLHQVLLQSYQDSTAVAADRWQPVVRQEDGQSDSSGETIPSDSGRGGSEEDISHASHVGAALNDDSRLAALHDASFHSSTSNNTFPGPPGSDQDYPNPYSTNPNKSSVRDPIRNSSRKHVTFKDLGAGKRGLRPLTNGGPGISGGSGGGVTYMRRDNNGAGTGQRSVGGGGGGGGPGCDLSPTGGPVSPRYTQLPNRDSPQHGTPSVGSPGNGDSLSSARGFNLQQETRDSPRSFPTGSSSGSSSRGAPGLQDGTRPAPTYVNEPYGNMPGSLSSPLSSPSSPKDWSRAPALLQRDCSRSDNLSRGQGPRSTFNTSQEMQTFVPPTRAGRDGGGNRDYRPFQQNSKTSRESPLASRHARDCHDSLATTDDGDDQRSTTTSGSYSIDNEDGYVGVELNHAPWKDVVV
ncbi:hypothetical protein ACOMHN_037008 [Nucella lapillus]